MARHAPSVSAGGTNENLSGPLLWAPVEESRGHGPPFRVTRALALSRDSCGRFPTEPQLSTLSRSQGRGSTGLHNLGRSPQRGASGTPGSGSGSAARSAHLLLRALPPQPGLFSHSREMESWAPWPDGINSWSILATHCFTFHFTGNVWMTRCLPENLGNVQAQERGAWRVCGCGSR